MTYVRDETPSMIDTDIEISQPSTRILSLSLIHRSLVAIGGTVPS